MGCFPSKTDVKSAVPAETAESHPPQTAEEFINNLEVPIYFIDFNDLLSRETFPRNPEDKDLAISVSEIDVSRSLLVFISHCWARGWPGAIGWDGRPHPDDMHHSKMALCKKGIKKLWDELAPSCDKCYVWLDFGCINQDGSPCAELKQLDKIIQFCDCVFTPIVEDDEDIKRHHNKVKNESGLETEDPALEIEDHQDEIAKHYNSKKWNGDDHAYLNRGWTRVEMFYASAIPFLAIGAESHLESAFNLGLKTSKFKAGLRSAVTNGRRPQFVYGTYQMHKRLPMRVLPPLMHSYFHRYNPINGCLSVASDRIKITTLVDELIPYLRFAEESYEGNVNSSNKKEGFGKCVYKNGDVYEGEFKNDEKCGKGVYHYVDGSTYSGEWKNNKENGFGTFTYACGDVYKGQMMNGQFHGHGEIVSVRGRNLEGDFVRDKFVKNHENNAKEDGDGQEFASAERFQGFERQLSTAWKGDAGCLDENIGFERDLSCSSGFSDNRSEGSDFDADLSVASFDS